ncbi:MAG: CPBP family intramembrane glutamic endopeptidase [Candidatus Bilamarchaeum sp.]|jgi:membrane protease YdiL (CAAX protease family)
MKKIFGFLFILSIVSFLLLYSYFRETQLYQFSVQLAIFSLGGFFTWQKDLKTTLAYIGFPGGIKTVLVYTVAGFACLFLGMLIIGAVSHLLGFNDQNKVADKIKDMKWYVLLMAIFMAPISEELFFRGYLTNKYGPIISAIIFGIVHIGYGSIIEVVGVAFVGLVFGYIFKKSGSITPGIIIHIGYNFISILAIRFLL